MTGSILHFTVIGPDICIRLPNPFKHSSAASPPKPSISSACSQLKAGKRQVAQSIHPQIPSLTNTTETMAVKISPYNSSQFPLRAQQDQHLSH